MGGGRAWRFCIFADYMCATVNLLKWYLSGPLSVGFANDTSSRAVIAKRTGHRAFDA